jgi:cytochrome c oxidase subunit 2
MRKHPLAQMLLIGAFASIVGVAITLAMDWFPVQADTAADDIDLLYDVLLMVSVPIFVLVMTVAIYSVVKFRAKPGDTRDGPPIHGNTRLEIVWVTIPFLLVTGLAIYGWIVLADIEEKQPNTMVVNVTGQQFAWSFEYPDDGKVKSNQLVLPKDRPVEFRIKALDVIHSFWVPEFRLKSDAVPGLTTKVRVTPDREGSYNVVCAELCGLGHSTMRQAVRVVPQTEFAAWIAKRSRGGAAAGARPGSGEQAGAGKQVFTDTGCNACHTLADAGASASIGPNLDQLARRAGRRRPGLSAEEYVKQSIEDPQAFVVKGFPGNTMPKNYKQQLTSEEIDALVEYLLGVSGDQGGRGQ